MVRHSHDWYGKSWKMKHTVGAVYKVNGQLLENYRGSKGYSAKWGRYVGAVGIMLDYLQYQKPNRYNFYDLLLTARNKRGAEKLTVDELDKLMLEIWALLDYDTQKKFEHYISLLDKNYREKYNDW